MSVDGAFNISKWLGVNSYFEVGHQIFRSPLYTEILNTSGTYCAGNINTSFQLGKGWIADLRGDYQSDVVYAQLLIKSFGTINIGVQKNIERQRKSETQPPTIFLYAARRWNHQQPKNTDADWKQSP
ncbi:MAG: outer membrane beta-barrel protein [Saprospiraceae bacterium]|nr:outer membrane beta-barrel protein [Saprospiraceae bacterium]